MDRVAIYLRKSRADLEAEARGEGETLAKHRRSLLDMAKKYNYTIQDVYEEIVSGERIVDRPEVQKLLHAVREGAYTAVMVMDIDRLGRGNMIDQGLIQDAFKSSNTKIITPRKMYDLNDEMDEEWSEFEAFMARRELKIITRRLQRGRIQSAKEGKSMTNKVPFGYVRGEDLILRPDPDTAPIVKLMFDMAARGMAPQYIAKHITNLGIPSPSGLSVWPKPTISALLRNPVYVGSIVWGKTKLQRKGSRTYNDESAWSYAEQAHEPIVDQDTFDKVQELRKSRSHRSTTGKPLRNPFASLIYCHHCGKAMIRKKRNNRPHDMLVCETYQCQSKSIIFDIAEDRLLYTLRQTLAELQIQTAPPIQESTQFIDSRIKALEKEISTLAAQMSSLHDLLERGVYTIDVFLERSRVLGDRLDMIKAELEAAKIDRDKMQMPANTKLPELIRAMDLYDLADTEQKNNLLKEVVEKIIYRRERDWTALDRFEIDIYLK